jgi:hypothetical protein
MYLLVYKGNCQSTIIGGKKFDKIHRTCNISDDESVNFVGNNGKSMYDDLEVIPIVKNDIVPENKKDGEGTPKDGEGTPKDGEGTPKDGEGTPKDGEGTPNDSSEVTVEGLKQKNTLEQLKAICQELGLNIEGSKTELAERIIEAKKPKE